MSPALAAAAALGSAACWAFATVLFGRLGHAVSPLGLSLGKGLISLVYIGVLVLLVGSSPMDARSAALLAASGVLGIAFGDTLYFEALGRLGARLTVLMAMTGPMLTVLLAVGLLGERLEGRGLAGVVLTLVGVAMVSWPTEEGVAPDRRGGMLYIGASVACMSGGVLLGKLGIAAVPVAQATAVRVAASVAALAALGLVRGSLGAWLSPFGDADVRRGMAGAAVVLCGGFLLAMASLKGLDATYATALGATEPILILPMTAVMLAQRVSWREALGALVGVAGTALVLTR